VKSGVLVHVGASAQKPIDDVDRGSDARERAEASACEKQPTSKSRQCHLDLPSGSAPSLRSRRRRRAPTSSSVSPMSPAAILLKSRSHQPPDRVDRLANTQ
ncbi:unnamed protein product, partial [Ixodes pacificus]